MIQITDIKIPLDGMNAATLTSVSARILKIDPAELRSVRLTKKSVDARKKEDVHFVCSGGGERRSSATEKGFVR